MKRLLVPLIIIVIFMWGCSPVLDRPSLDNAEEFSSVASFIKELTHKDGYVTEVEVTINTPETISYGYSAYLNGGVFSARISDGKTAHYTGTIDSIKNAYNDNLENSDDEESFSGNLTSILMLPMSDLIDLSAENVRSSTKMVNDDITTFFIDLYESKVQNALFALSNEFDKIEDIKEFVMTLKTDGTYVSVNVQSVLKYTELKEDIEVTLTLFYRKVLS